MVAHRTGNYGPQVVETLVSVVHFGVGPLAPGATAVVLPVPGALPTDGCQVNPPQGFSNDLFLVHMHAQVDAVGVEMFNFSGAPIDPGAIDYVVSLFRVPS